MICLRIMYEYRPNHFSWSTDTDIIVPAVIGVLAFWHFGAAAQALRGRDKRLQFWAMVIDVWLEAQCLWICGGSYQLSQLPQRVRFQ